MDTKYLLHLDNTVVSETLDGVTPTTSLNASYSGCYFSTTQKMFGTHSLFFKDANTNFGTWAGWGINLDVSVVDISKTQPFTIEMWIYPTAGSNAITCGLFHKGGGYAEMDFAWDRSDMRIYTNTSGNLCLDTYGGANIVGNVPVTEQSWNHIAITNDGTTTHRAFVNGTLAGTTTGTHTTNASSNKVLVGWTSFSTNSQIMYRGYIDEFRYSKACLYTSNFTPPGGSFKNRDIRTKSPLPIIRPA